MTSEADDIETLAPGSRLGEYCIRSLLGRGGFGATYLAEDALLGTEVAIKEFLPYGLARRIGSQVVPVVASDPAENERTAQIFVWGRQRFLDEARTLAMFRNPNIVRVSRLFEANDTAYLVMDFERGRSLSQHLDQIGRTLSERELLNIINPLLDGLAAVHRAGYLHRDIKPGNILIRTDGSPVLLDFGSARHALAGQQSGFTVIVTPGFSPPEQYDQQGAQGPWTDIYALGAVLYWAVSCTLPINGMIRRRQDTLVPAVTCGQGRYSKDFLAAIDWALMLEPERRPQSLAAWRAALCARLLPSDAPPPRKPAIARDPVEETSDRWAIPDPALNADSTVSIAVPGAPEPARTDGQTALELRHNDQAVVCDREHDTVWIGRDPKCDLVIDDNRVSRRHAVIRCRGDTFEITDDSRWGTHIQGDGSTPVSLSKSSSFIEGSGMLWLGRTPGSGSRVDVRMIGGGVQAAGMAAISGVVKGISDVCRRLWTGR